MAEGSSPDQPLSCPQDNDSGTGDIPEAAPEGKEQTDMNHSEKQNPLFQNITDLAGVDWVEFLQNLTYVIAMLPSYKEQLQTDQMMADQMIVDIMHFVELYEYDDRNALEMMEKLREVRKERRIVKNELYRVERFQNAVGSNTIAIRCKDALKQIQAKEAGRYRPRVAPELFEEKELAPFVLHKCYADKESLLHDSTSDGRNGETGETIKNECMEETEITWKGKIYVRKKICF